MSDFPSVASVLLIAIPARSRELAPWLRVVGQPVRYTLEVLEPSAARPRPDPAWSVIVIDGDSVATDAEREEILRRMAGQLFATTLYIAQHAAHDPDVERDQAFTWANDLIWQGWELGDRLRRRVQEIAIAPWLRSMALRAEAERLGDRRVRVVRPAGRWTERGERADEPTTRRVRRLDRALPFVLAEKASKLGGAVPELVASAFHEGRRIGVASVRESADAFCASLLEELDGSFDTTTPEHAVGLIQSELRRLVREELAAIDLHEARPVYDP